MLTLAGEFDGDKGQRRQWTMVNSHLFQFSSDAYMWVSVGWLGICRFQRVVGERRRPFEQVVRERRGRFQPVVPKRQRDRLETPSHLADGSILVVEVRHLKIE